MATFFLGARGGLIRGGPLYSTFNQILRSNRKHFIVSVKVRHKQWLLHYKIKVTLKCLKVQCFQRDLALQGYCITTSVSRSCNIVFFLKKNMHWIIFLNVHYDNESILIIRLLDNKIILYGTKLYKEGLF